LGHEGQLYLGGRASYEPAGRRCLTSLTPHTLATGNGPPVRDVHPLTMAMPAVPFWSPQPERKPTP
jgi:hypothetical protein